MSMTVTETSRGRTSLTLTRSLRRDGVLGLLGRLRSRDAEAYEAWLEERDMTAITSRLMRLSERQLNRIGMSRRTLAMDVDDLAERTRRERLIAREVLEIVYEAERPRAIAAE